MKKEKKNLIENFLSLGALQIFTYFMPFITLPYLSRVLGPELFGLVFFAQAFMGYFTMLTDFGFNLSATREIAVNRHNINNISYIFSAVMVIKWILVVISFLCILIAIAFVPKIHDNGLMFILTFFMVVGSAIYPSWFFQGMERMKYITCLNILAKLISLILIFILVKTREDYIIVPLLYSLGSIVAGLIGVIFAIKEFGVKLCLPSKNFILKQFKYSTEFFLSRASIALYTNTNAFFLGLISSNLMVGYYVAAEKIYKAISAMVSPLNRSLYPYVTKYKDIKTYKKLSLLACLCSFVGCTLIIIFAKDIITVFYGAEMLNAYKILRIFSFAIIITIPSVLLGYPLLAAMNHAKEANVSVIFSSFFHITGLFLLFILGKLNVYTMACLVLVTETFVLMFRVYYVWKYKLLNV